MSKKNLWDLPTRAIADYFLKLLTRLWSEARLGICNLEMPLIFPAYIFHKCREIFLERMDAWETGSIVTLI